MSESFTCSVYLLLDLFFFSTFDIRAGLAGYSKLTEIEDEKVETNRFDGNDFNLWKIQIEDYLYQRNLHLPHARQTRVGYYSVDVGL